MPFFGCHVIGLVTRNTAGTIRRCLYPTRQLQQERKQNLELAREVHTEKAHADRARQEVDALTQTKQAVETAHR